MKFNLKPETRSGKWSVGLNTLFLFAMLVSVVLVQVLGMLSFDDRWWDVTVAVAFSAAIIALITGVIAVGKNKDRSFLVFLSTFIGIGAILFIFLHSLFISD